MRKSRSTLHNSFIISFGILVSRILGFLRDKVIAYFLPREYRDLFFLGLMFPNTLARLLGEGALSSGFLPTLSRQSREGQEERSNELTTYLINMLGVVSIMLALVLWAVVPSMYEILFTAKSRNPALFETGIRITRMMVPYVTCICICSVGMAFLNAKKHFLVPAISSSLLNSTLIILPLLHVMLGEYTEESVIFYLSLAVIVGGVIQAAVFIMTMIRLGFQYKGLIFRFSEDLKAGLGRMVPSMVGMSAMQINILVDKTLAWLLPAGGISALYYAGHLFHLPLALIGYSVSVAVFPETSVRSGNELSSKVRESREMIILGVTPAIAGLIAAGPWIIRGLFFGGEFDGWDLQATYVTLLFYVVGVHFHSLYKLSLTVFYSMDDTMTPLKVSLIGIVLNIVLNLVLMRFLSFAGLALATTITGGVNLFISERILSRRGVEMTGRGAGKFLAKSFLAAILMGGCVWLVGKGLDRLIRDLTLLKLGIIIITGVIVHYGIARVLGFREALDYYGRIFRKVRGRR